MSVVFPSAGSYFLQSAQRGWWVLGKTSNAWGDVPVLEMLEPRLLLSGTSYLVESLAESAVNTGAGAVAAPTADYGPRVVSHTPTDPLAAAELLSLTVTFNEPVDRNSLVVF